MSRLSVRHCSRFNRSRFKNIQATGKKTKVLWSLTNWRIDSIDRNRRKIDYADFELGPSRWKCLGFQSDTFKYKWKALTMFWRLLEDLWITPVRSKRFCNLLTLQVSKGKRSTIKCLWNLVAATRSITGDLNLWVGSQSHKRGSLCLANPREKSSWSRSLHMVVLVKDRKSVV